MTVHQSPYGASLPTRHAHHRTLSSAEDINLDNRGGRSCTGTIGPGRPRPVGNKSANISSENDTTMLGQKPERAQTDEPVLTEMISSFTVTAAVPPPG
jgi:hypothetical protein